ncbi:UDP-N-acetylmuramoyl-L-alanyl-D-glutamate--2,6-diaminopimelate ligase [Mycoplasma sp. P36-A1]|uniref:UDP-N-acetylmuramoyl-L-alanyl-D-glutamate--2, 6-diaminopimelate ligase n=1 Tax=Mycoplasma sp. P36-A1 TaxID=3252900 RepID=UPI003C2C8736
MKLKELYNIDSDINVEYLSEDNRDIKPNSLYFALEGANFDGHSAIDQVINDGAKVIVHTKNLTNYQDDIVYLKVEDINKTMAEIANAFYNNASDKMVVTGITGTNGKTTIAWLLHDILTKLSSSGYIGTIGIEYNNKVLKNHFTTPKPIELNSVLSKMKQDNVKYVNLEVSSHALEQKRSHSIDIDYAVMSNFTNDHENFHGGMENYKKAKQILFKGLKKEAYAILNKDDITYDEYSKCTKAKVISYGIRNNADVMASNIVLNKKNTTFDLKLFDKNYKIQSNLVAEFNVYNLLPVITICYLEGFDIEKIMPLFNEFSYPQGRMENLDYGQDYTVIVDYAHTPDGFEKVFTYAKEIANADIISVFGSAGGDRDKSKRPVLGNIASKYSSQIILTQEDPRTEKVEDINSEIASGFIYNTNYIQFSKRKDALIHAINNAKKDDLILILAKANDKYNVVGINEDEPYEGDIDLSKRLINERLGKENEIK